MEQVATGSYTGNGAAQNISLGWVPDHIKVINVTDSDATWEWFKGMTDGTAVKTSAAVAPLAANGISEYAGSAVPGSEAGAGFTIGTDLSEDTKVHRYIAYRNGPGLN